MELRLIIENKKFWIAASVLLILSMVLFGNFKRDEVDSSFSYKKYIESIYNSKQRMEISIFKDKADNLQKDEMTADAYNRVKNIRISKGDYAAAGTVVSFGLSKFVFLIYAVVFVWGFIETDRGKSPLLFTLPKGRSFLAWQRIAAIFLSSLIFLGIWFVGIYLIAVIKNGIDSSYMVYAQSVYELHECIFDIEVWQYLILEFALLVVGLAVTVIFVWLIKRIVSINIVAMVIVAALYVVEYLLLGLGEQSRYVLLKYINLWNLLNPYEVIGSYRVLSVGDWLCGSIEAFIIFLASCLIILPLAIVLVENKRMGGVRIKIGCPAVINKLFLYILSKLNLFGLECYKILFEQKGIVCIAAIFITIFGMVDTNTITYYGVNEWKNAVYEAYSGRDLSEIEEYAAQESKRIRQIEADYILAEKKFEKGELTEDELDKYSTKAGMVDIEREGLIDIKSQLASLKRSKEAGIDVCFMDNKAYQILWKSNENYVSRTDTRRRVYGLMAVVFVIFLTGFLFSYEKDMKLEKLIRPLSGSRRELFRLRHIILIMNCVIAWCVIYGLELYQVYKVYGLRYLAAPVQSVVFLENFPLRIPIWGYLVIIEMFHLVSLYAVGWMTVCVCSRLGSVKGMIVSLLFLCGPEILNMVSNLDMHWLSAVQIVLETERICRYNMVVYVSSLVVLAMMAVYCFCEVEDRYR